MNQLKEKIMKILTPHQLMCLATLTKEGKPWVRYVTGEAPDDETIRIATFSNSRKVAQIQNNPEVHITCGFTIPEQSRGYLQIAGTAQVSNSEEDRNLCWHDGLKEYFKGPDDPLYSVIFVHPYRIEYMGPGAMKPEVWEPTRN
ncbi:MAG: pyridoxamine 5'-phosphate oxidase family protein [Acidobacteria bacterium]|nr:pyridoxamine 5'-phosphate oxidase family protein [Acidobacteriota bacterium]